MTNGQWHYSAVKTGSLLLQTVVVLVQSTKHEFELFFMCAEILSELLKVQHSVLVGVPGLHDLMAQTGEVMKNGCWVIGRHVVRDQKHSVS